MVSPLFNSMNNTDLHIHLCFVRHAETEANAAGIRQVYLTYHSPKLYNFFINYKYQGQSDYPLTEAGILDTDRLGGALRNTPWDFVVCSDLPRCRKTLDLLQEKRQKPLDLDVHFTSSVREVNFGIREGLPKGTSVEEARVLISQQTGQAAESVEDSAKSEMAVLERQKVFLAELHATLAVSASSLSCSVPLSQSSPVKVLCVSHGGFIKRFLANFANVIVDAVPNCSITTVHIEFLGEKSRGTPLCRVLDVCEQPHLHPLQAVPGAVVEEVLWSRWE